ncbi:MAG: hypothetical protein IPP15_01345 [Saprospiraceae bacterium]|uniref:DUF2116 family Zn-ribbon domain-containing protein n=1 Tax=Candidatus Opimibacter skivensis TaxID=2982028 RepID=A0A9D7SS95_9BACT|nr:hypothetical protein [Candidatus Opimibacter skivensis]
MLANKCLHCGKPVKGRTDKKFCSILCKNNFNYEQRTRTKSDVKTIDDILHRNRIILSTLMGDSRKETFDRMLLLKAKFRFDFHTGHYLNKEGKTYWLIYDYAWMEFSDQKILVIRKMY